MLGHIASFRSSCLLIFSVLSRHLSASKQTISSSVASLTTKPRHTLGHAIHHVDQSLGVSSVSLLHLSYRSKKSHEFHGADIVITYTLFFVGIALDVASLLMVMPS
ncbi:unnamed protein product [Microthlaspi erraticum]|uniref:Uncharacterized protein n=1 Tax=Microthlaspi erraticum TaxID=1685480 RepID=A0A6D2HD76_9BRAS|nr:unnamed protein product [Microthlaspi erraticum]